MRPPSAALAPPRVRARVVSRRSFLGGGAALAGAALVGIPACDAPADTGVDTVLDPPITAIAPVTPNEDFYVTSCCGTPDVDAATWALVVRVRGEEVARVDLAGLQAAAAVVDIEHTLECISANPYNRAIGNAIWTGASLAAVLDALGVTVPPEAVELKFTSADAYTTAIPVGDLPNLSIVWAMNGAPLPPEHGYPARLLVPGRYGMKNPKWIVEIDLVDTPWVGFWEERGWSNEAFYKPNSLVLVPSRLEAIVEAGPVRVLGSAFAGTDPVVRVEVAVGDGAWEEAVLDYAPGANVWTLWHVDLELAVGTHLVRTRCTTASGAVTAENPEGTDPLEGYDGGMELAIEAV